MTQPGVKFHNPRDDVDMETRGIAVFDVCGTLTRTNNTLHFIQFVLRQDRPLRYGLLVLLRILAPLFRLPGIRSLFRRDLLRDGQIALLRGYSCARIRAMSERYVDDLFAKGLLNDRILEALRQERNQGRTVFLVSSAIDPPIVELARRLDVRHCFSSELEVENGHYTGRLQTDLWGRKQSVLQRMPAHVDLHESSVYSDNLEDSDFLQCFGRRHVILNTREAKRVWDAREKGFHFVINYEEGSKDRDVHSVNERTVKWVYVPSLYYLISRFHREGVPTLFFREIVPVTVMSYLVTHRDAFSFLLMPLSFLMFYAVYEIGGLVNDLAVERETPEDSRTRRIAPGVRLHIALFIAVRLALVGVLLALLPLGACPVLLYAGALCGCLVIFFLHTLILSHRRVLTFALLKICRTSIPLLILASSVPPAMLLSLCVIFSGLEAPWRIYMYSYSRGLVTGKMSVRDVRCATTAVLWGVGAILYLIAGSPPLLVIASYYVVLDCLGIMRRKEKDW